MGGGNNQRWLQEGWGRRVSPHSSDPYALLGIPKDPEWIGMKQQLLGGSSHEAEVPVERYSPSSSTEEDTECFKSDLEL